MKLSIALSSLLLASGMSTTITTSSSHGSFLERSASIWIHKQIRRNAFHSVFESEISHWLLQLLYTTILYFQIS